MKPPRGKPIGSKRGRGRGCIRCLVPLSPGVLKNSSVDLAGQQGNGVAERLPQINARQVKGIRAFHPRKLQRRIDRHHRAAASVDALAKVVFGMDGQ